MSLWVIYWSPLRELAFLSEMSRIALRLFAPHDHSPMPSLSTCAPRITAIGCLLLAAVAGGGCAENSSPADSTAEPNTVARASNSEPQNKPRRKMYRRCDANILAKRSTTTCAFAQNVFWSYWTFENTQSLDVWSPASEQAFEVACSEGSTMVRCTTADGAAVKFSLESVGDYSQQAADDFASSHDLGPDPYEFNSTSPADPGYDDYEDPGDNAGESNGCESGYSPCLESGIGDFDCEGGSGDGPNYTGPVEVTGSDPFDLDRDRDGYGCE